MNDTVPNGTTITTPQAAPSDLSGLLGIMLSMSALRDWLKLFVLGGILETCRRFASTLWQSAINSFFITAQFKEDDPSFDWMMLWLSKQPSWKKAREVEISTANFGLSSSAILVPGESSNPSDHSRKLAYIPSVSATYSLFYKGRWIQILRSQQNNGFYGQTTDTLQISIFTRDLGFLNELLLEAKKEYLAAEEHNISVFISDSSSNWRHVASRPKRPMGSIVLDPGIKDLLVSDAKDFLASKSWYAARGIPFRRGYLLYGAPGSGKTSIIHSLAGELGLDIYVLSLSRAGLDDAGLEELISDLPERCIALMEDVDAAFSGGGKRDLEEAPNAKVEGNTAPNNSNATSAQPPNPSSGPSSSASRITLSGLLNALDGVGAQEGRILFATTNKYSALDPALIRPGRMDLHVEFKRASQAQAEELFKCFYMPDGEEKEEDVKKKEEKKVADSGYNSPDSGTPTTEKDLIDLTPTAADEKKELTTLAYTGTSHLIHSPKLTPQQITDFAHEFAAAIPEREFSMASLQGYLMSYKSRPGEAAKEAGNWVERERMERKRKEDERREVKL